MGSSAGMNGSRLRLGVASCKGKKTRCVAICKEWKGMTVVEGEEM